MWGSEGPLLGLRYQLGTLRNQFVIISTHGLPRLPPTLRFLVNHVSKQYAKYDESGPPKQSELMVHDAPTHLGFDVTTRRFTSGAARRARTVGNGLLKATGL